MARSIWRPVSWLTTLVAGLAVVGCGGGERASRGPAMTSPTAPSGVAAPAGPAPAAGVAGGPSAPVPAADAPPSFGAVALPPDAVSRPSAVAFPPRNESFLFRQDLETLYRTGLQRPQGSSFVDAEGDLVWTQEYLRYRVNGCGHEEAVTRVFRQIDGGGIAPVCGDSPSGVVAFPPRDQSFQFRQQLEAKYRDQLRRPPSSTFVDVEGSIVWTQEYLRYRVNNCDHIIATLRVAQQIEGRGIGPVCQASNMTGQWAGTIEMPGGRGFTMSVIQDGSDFVGNYRDIASGTVTGSYRVGSDVQFFVFFGDGSALFSGRFVSENRVRGSMRYDKIDATFGFEMNRTSTTPSF